LLDLRAQVGDCALDREPRLRESRANAALHVRGLGRVVARQRREPREPRIGIVVVLEHRCERSIVRGCVEPVAADERYSLFVECEALERDIDAVDEQVAVQRAFFRQICGQGRQALTEPQQLRLAIRDRGGRVVRPAPQGGAIAALPGAHGVLDAGVRVVVAHDGRDVVCARDGRHQSDHQRAKPEQSQSPHVIPRHTP
jgi:hypothetical protein